MLSRDNPFKDNNKDEDLLFYDEEIFLKTNLINTICSMYSFYETCSRAEEVITKIINEGKKIYLESEEA